MYFCACSYLLILSFNSKFTNGVYFILNRVGEGHTGEEDDEVIETIKGIKNDYPSKEKDNIVDDISHIELEASTKRDPGEGILKATCTIGSCLISLCEKGDNSQLFLIF